MKGPAVAQKLSAYLAANPIRRGPVCTVCVLPEDMQEALAAEHSRGTPATMLSRFLRSEGVQVSGNTLARHFREHVGNR